jgi:hypothetical protein
MPRTQAETGWERGQILTQQQVSKCQPVSRGPTGSRDHKLMSSGTILYANALYTAPAGFIESATRRGDVRGARPARRSAPI